LPPSLYKPDSSTTAVSVGKPQLFDPLDTVGKQLQSLGDLATTFLHMVHAFGTNFSNAQVMYTHWFPKRVA
jgi:hypothetical protein